VSPKASCLVRRLLVLMRLQVAEGDPDVHFIAPYTAPSTSGSRGNSRGNSRSGSPPPYFFHNARAPTHVSHCFGFPLCLVPGSPSRRALPVSMNRDRIRGEPSTPNSEYPGRGRGHLFAFFQLVKPSGLVLAGRAFARACVFFGVLWSVVTFGSSISKAWLHAKT
jgi:hypothetical protein